MIYLCYIAAMKRRYKNKHMVQIKITNSETFKNSVSDVEFDNISCSFDRVGDLCSVTGTVTIEKANGGKSIFSGEHGIKDYMRDYGFIIEEIPTFDVEFNDDQDSDSKGFEMSLEEARDYIETWNGSGRSYFGDYEGGTVSIINNLTGESVEDFEVK